MRNTSDRQSITSDDLLYAIKHALFKNIEEDKLNKMPRPSEREIDESYEREGLIFDEEDAALMNHIFNDDAPPQGLHQGGRKETSAQEDDYV